LQVKNRSTAEAEPSARLKRGCYTSCAG
jgi:hypothetical protein